MNPWIKQLHGGQIGWCCCLLLLLAPPAQSQEWTRFRGPNGTGESETEITATWTPEEYNWRVELPGLGHSSPVLWGDRIFLTSADQSGQQRMLLCLAAADGKILWQKTLPAETHRLHQQNSFATSTPAVDADHVYVAWAMPAHYWITALHHDGSQAWQVDLGPFDSQHGYGTSPIVYEDLVVVNDDQDGDSSLVALDRKNGSQRWRVPRRTKVAAYSTPCVYRPTGGQDELIFNSQAHGITGIDPRSGRTLWEIDVFDKRSVSSPLVVGDLIFGSCGSGGGGNYVVAIEPGEQPKIAYRIDKSAPYVPTSVARGNRLFLWSDAGVVSCVAAPTGEVIWQKRVGGNFSGSPVRAAGRLYCMSMEGEVVVLAAADEFALLGRNPLGELSRSTPAIAGGKMYLRTQSHLISVGGRTNNTVKSD